MPPQTIIDAAIEASMQSPCQSKRGAAIYTGQELVSVGFNHKPKGFVCDGSTECKMKCSKDAVHAEQAAILRGHHLRGCEMLHVKTVGGKLVPSMGPSCLQCSKLILEAGIAQMWLFHVNSWKAYAAKEFHYLSGAYIPKLR